VTAALACLLLATAAAAAVRRERRRAELVTAAAHELRGSATAIALAAASLRREPGGLRRALAFESEIARMRAGLEDLELARHGRRAPARPAVVPAERLLRGAAAGWRPAARKAGRSLRFRWEGPPAEIMADRSRVAQALGNLLANAMEHGSGPVEVRGRRSGRRVLVEVRDGGPASDGQNADGADRGRGLSIAARAVEEAGGTLTVDHAADATTAAIEFPVAEP
jgi:signal transduction histidine kinase